jgi:arylsulfatase A-like enzyme
MAPSRPNLLFIFGDQHRGMDMGCAGNPEVRTPRMDQLAAEGVRFACAYANTPVCTPSRAMLLTGLYPLDNRVVANDLPIPEELPSLGKSFRAAGYRTGYIGKWHLDGVPRDRWTPPGPRRHGFDFWAAYNCSHDYLRDEKYFRDQPVPLSIPGYEPEIQTNVALDFLAQADARPFCLFLSWGPPHDPYPMVPEAYRALYDPEALSLRPNVTERLHPDAEPLRRGLEARRTIADYYAAITALDDQLGRLLDFLAATGQAENTIVVFTSDHGDMLWSQGRMKKQQPWEESISIPFIVRWPGQAPAGKVHDGQLSIIDFAPTLLALCEVEHPVALPGFDWSRALRGEVVSGPDTVYLLNVTTVDESQLQNLPEWRGLRTQRYTYAEAVPGEPWLLYDNEMDPYQQVNLIADPVYADVRTALQEALAAWLVRTGDTGAGGKEIMAQLGLADLWNQREAHMHPNAPNLI